MRRIVMLVLTLGCEAADVPACSLDQYVAYVTGDPDGPIGLRADGTVERCSVPKR